MNATKVILGVLAGITTGALVGVLFAPDKGSRTRKKMLGKGEDLINRGGDFIDKKERQFMDKGGEILEKGENFAHKMIRKTDDFVEEKEADAERKASGIKSKYERLKGEVS